MVAIDRVYNAYTLRER